MKIRKARKEDMRDIQDLRYLLAKYDKSSNAIPRR